MVTVPSNAELWNAVHACTQEVLSSAIVDPPNESDKTNHLELAEADIASLPQLIAEIERAPHARAKLELPRNDSQDDWYVAGHEVAQIPITLATKALQSRVHQGQIDESLLLAHYVPYERYLLSDATRMTADIVVPILGVDPQPIASADGSWRVEPIPEDRSRVFRSNKSRSQIASYDVDILNSPSMSFRLCDTTVRVEGFGRYHYAHLTDDAEKAIERFFESLTIASPSPAEWAEYAVVASDWSAWPSEEEGPVNVVRDYTGRIDRIRYPGITFAPTKLDQSQSNLALQINERLPHCDRSVQAAATRYRRALARDNGDDRIVDLCIAIEALFGSGSAEIVHRLSMRTAAMLSTLWGAPARDIYGATKEMYNHRSKVVHGGTVEYMEAAITFAGGPPMHVSRFGSAAVSTILRNAILDPDFSPKTVDDRYVFTALDAMVNQVASEVK